MNYEEEYNIGFELGIKLGKMIFKLHKQGVPISEIAEKCKLEEGKVKEFVEEVF